MPIEPPSWATPAELDTHGSYFVASFSSRARFDYWLTHGELGTEANDRRKAKLAADPIEAQRERLARRIRSTRGTLTKVEHRLSELQSNSALGFIHGPTLRALPARIAFLQATIASTEVDLALLEALHQR